MRSAFAISLVIHTAILLWITLAPGAKPFDPARAEPIMVDLLSPQEAPPLAEPQPAKTESAKSEDPSKRIKSFCGALADAETRLD
jgi:hypothetical protein